MDVLSLSLISGEKHMLTQHLAMKVILRYSKFREHHLAPGQLLGLTVKILAHSSGLEPRNPQDVLGFGLCGPLEIDED